MKNKHTILTMIFALCYSLILHSQINIAQLDKKFENIKKISVQGDFCNVEVNTTQSNQIHFKGEVNSDNANIQIQILYKQEKDILKVWIKRPNVINNKVKGKLVLIVPYNTAVMVKNSSGQVYVDGIVNNDFDIETISGSVNIKNVKSNAKIKSHSGSIFVSENYGNLNLNSVSGRLIVSNQKGLIKAETISGVISIDGLVGDLNFISVSGNVKLKNSNGKIKIETNSGNIEGSSVFLTANSFFETISGSIAIDFSNNFSDLGFDLDSTSGKINVFGKKHNEKFVKELGKIKVKGTTVSGNQKYY